MKSWNGAQEGQGDILLFTGPHGAGKETSLNMLAESPYLGAVRHVRYITRPPAENEVDGQAYHFVSHETFDELTAQDFFLDTMANPVAISGVARQALQRDVRENRFVCMSMNVPEGLSVYEKLKAENLGRRVLLFFISPCPEETMRNEHVWYLKRLEDRMWCRGRRGIGQGMEGRLRLAQEYRDLYYENEDKMIYIANEDGETLRTHTQLIHA